MQIVDSMDDQVDIAIVGAGAAGLMAAIFAGRTAGRRHRIVALDGARKVGAKILVSGGGRCNVTHERVAPDDFNGSSRNAIAKVLRAFDVPTTIAFFRELNVELKREPTGKLFPVTDSARTPLNALLGAVRNAGVQLFESRRVEAVERTSTDDPAFIISGDWGSLRARRVILATGGKSLPKTGSDGHGYTMVTRLGHSLTPRIIPALAPLVLDSNCLVTSLSGVATEATLAVYSSTNKRLVELTGSLLLTHFGLSGPAAMDISRHWSMAKLDDDGVRLVINWLPGERMETLDRTWLDRGRLSFMQLLRDRLPERLVRALIEHAGVEPTRPVDQTPREQRRNLARTLTEWTAPVIETRGFRYAEVTAGGVPLSEAHLHTMESRVRPGLYLCGEILDVDGRIGGFNFQWAWTSGYLAGVAAARSIAE